MGLRMVTVLERLESLEEDVEADRSVEGGLALTDHHVDHVHLRHC